MRPSRRNRPPRTPRSGPAVAALAAGTGALVGLALAPSLAGASGARDPLSAAVRATTGAGSEHFTMALSLATRAPGQATRFGLTASGVMDNPSTATGAGGTASPFGGAAADVHLHVARVGAIDLRMTGGALYVHLPPAVAAKLPLPGGPKPWLAVDVAGLRKAVGAPATGRTGTGALPGLASGALQALRGVSTGVTEVGTATVRHVPTTEYVAQVDLAKLATLDPALTPARLHQLETALPTTTIPVEVWVDAAGRVRQEHVRLVIPLGPTTASGGSGTATVSFTLDLFDYGPAVVLAAPPTGQVANVTSQVVAALSHGGLAGAGGAGGAGGHRPPPDPCCAIVPTWPPTERLSTSLK